MNFVITARRSARQVSFQRGSMLAALEQALTLASSGMEDVLIRDGNGRCRTPAEFSRTLLASGTEARGTAPRAA